MEIKTVCCKRIKVDYKEKKKSKQFEWYAVLIRIDSRLVFLYKKRFLQAKMIIGRGTTNYLKILFLTNASLTVNVVKDGRIIPIFGIICEFLMRSQ